MGILLPLEHLHYSSLTVNIISPYIFVKHSKHLKHWLQYRYHAICIKLYSALLKSESLKFHFLFSHCNILHSVTVHIPSRCCSSALQLFQKATRSEKVSKVHMEWSFSCHVSTLMYASTRPAPKPNSLYCSAYLGIQSIIHLHPQTIYMWVAPIQSLQLQCFGCPCKTHTHLCLWKWTCSLFNDMMS